MTDEHLANLARLIGLVLTKVYDYDEQVGDFDHRDYSGWRKRKKAPEADLLAYFTDHEGAQFSERPPHDHRVRMAGIRSTSTSGYRGALTNWKRVAETRLAAAAGEIRKG